MGRKNLALGGIVALAVLAGVIYFLTQKNTQTAPATLEEQQPETRDNDAAIEEEATEAVVVTYTDEGYSPGSVTITAGTTVRFVNNSNRSMWTASDPHPTHTNNSDFDPKKGFGKGETYSFTFAESGSYTYHNHLNPSHRGTVTVQ